ncbi:uncharacterized protein LOC131943877 [Physella acuta]|uniref:uncharacterized protein LOC131943877 n=1 Tax=Physella acuta TaxID=109671 RepID=UPI0027DE7FAE|nr:uncharacterized protein LOC131943877 [Physella acuta]
MARIFQPINDQPSAVQHVTFDPAAPPVLVPREVFSPLSFKNVLYHQSAFWALFAPTSKDTFTSGLVHRLSCQRLLWEIGGRVGFYQLDDVEVRVVKPSLSPKSGSTDEFVQGLMSYLTEWSCPKNLTFFQCVVKLSNDLVAQKFWTSKELQMMMVWVEDLIHIGYTQPQRKRHTDEFQFYSKRTSRVGYRDDRKFTRVSYAPLEQAPPAPFEKTPSRSQISRQASKITAMCPNLKLHEQGNTHADDSDKTTFFHDILLIVVYNHFYYNNTLYLDTIHRTMFRHIVYCGESLAKFQKETKDNGTQFTFIEASVFLGFTAYHCVIKAMQMGHKVKGYLMAGDDVMFKPWTLLKADKNKIWVTDEGRWFGVKKSEATSRWIWWGMSIGREAYLKTLEDLRNTKEFPKGVRAWQELQSNMAAHTSSEDVTEIRLSDLFYIPSRLLHETCWYLTRFLQHDVYLEIAVPAVLRGLGASDIHYIHGKSLWMEERKDTFRFYYTVESFFHPAKFSSNTVRAGYCQLYFPDLLHYIFGYKRRFLYAIT